MFQIFLYTSYMHKNENNFNGMSGNMLCGYVKTSDVIQTIW